MLLSAVSCGKKKDTGSSHNDLNKCRFHAEAFLNDPPLDHSTSVSYVRSHISRRIAGGNNMDYYYHYGTGDIPHYPNGQQYKNSYGRNYNNSYNANCDGHGYGQQNNGYGYGYGQQNNGYGYGYGPQNNGYGHGYGQQNNRYGYGQISSLEAVRTNELPHGNNKDRSLDNLKMRIQKPENFPTGTTSFNYTNYYPRSGFKQGMYPPGTPQTNTYTYKNAGQRNCSSHEKLVKIVSNADGSYHYRHGVHYIRTHDGIVYGITFNLPICANPIAERNIKTDSGYFINIGSSQ